MLAGHVPPEDNPPVRALWSDAPALTDTEGAFGLVALALVTAVTLLTRAREERVNAASR